ncbi:MAG: oligosaccharide flippase family protein [Bacteroidota bacterium]
MNKLTVFFSKFKSDINLKKVFSNSLYLFSIQALNYLFPFLAFPFLLATLSSDSFGIYVFSLAAIQFMMLFVDFGFTISIPKKIAGFKDNSKEIIETYWLISIIQLVFFFIILIIYLIIIFSFSSLYVYRWGILTASISAFGFALFPNWLFQGLDKMKTLSIINFTSKFLTYPLFFFLINNKNDHILAIFIQSLSFLVAGIISIIVIFREKRFRDFNTEIITVANIKHEILESKNIFLSNSAITIITSSFTLLLGLFSTSFYVGLFGAIDKIIQAMSFSIFVPINQAFFPMLVKLGISNLDKAKKIFKIVFYLILIIMILEYIGIILFEDFILDKFFHNFGDVKQIFRITALTIFPITLGGVCGQLGLIALGDNKDKKIFSSIYIYTSFISLPLSFLLIYFFNFNGAVFSMMLSQTVIFAFMFYFVKKQKII